MDKLDYDKVKAIIDEKSIKESNIYKELGISRQLWSSFKKTGIPAKYAIDVALFLGVDIKVLMPSSTPMLHDYDKVTIKAYKNIVASAGTSNDITNLDELDFEPMEINYNILPSRIKTQRLKGIQVSGKSMLPTFMPDDWVVFEENINSFQGDDVYVVNYLNNLLVKRLSFNPEKGKIDIISDNPAFPTYSVIINETEDKGFMIIGRVVATIQQ